MIQKNEFTYPSADHQTDIHAIEWIPDVPMTGVLQIVHGMQEFVDRYDDFARYMCSFGFLVVGNDHLGHGTSVRSEKYYGYFAEKNGNKTVIADMRELQRRVQLQHPDLPYFMLGHSMGSFLCRQYLCLYGNFLDGAVISGTAWHSAEEATLGMAMCRMMASQKGWMYRSPFMTKLAMGNYNKKIQPLRTPQDWLTRDEKIVDAYRADKRTQFLFTLNGYYNLFANLKFLTVKENLWKMPKELPVFFIAGEMDPVGNYGRGVKQAAVSFRSAGMQNVTCRLYPHDRHEVLNELDKADVYEDVRTWMEGVLRSR